MMRLRFLASALMIAAILPAGRLLAEDSDASPVDRLKEAIKLCDDAQYEAAHTILIEIDGDEFTEDDERLLFQNYLSKTERALAGVAEAKQDFAGAQEAVENDDLAEALRLFTRVSKNEYAPADLKKQAVAKASELAAKVKPDPEPEPGKDAMADGSSESKSAPTKQDSTSGKSGAAPGGEASSSATAGSKGATIVEQLALEHELLWQQAVRTYKDTEQKIRKAVLREEFVEARGLLDSARQVIELNRRYASPPALYEDYKAQADELARFVEEEERLYDERLVQEKAIEIAQREQERQERDQLQRELRISQLMDQADQLRTERRYQDAIQVLDQVLTLDPENDQAAWMLETLGDLALSISARDTFRTKDKQTEDLIIENTESSIPWHDEIIYPKNWPEISARRSSAEEAAEPESNRQTRKKLRTVAPELRFDAQPFEEVIETLRALTGLNIVPNWAALEAVAIDRDYEVTLKLQNTSFEKALQLILDAVGAGEVELAFEIDEGVITISTKEDLSRRTLTRVYNVQDLIISVPTFRGRQINLDQIGQTQGQLGGLGGGRFLTGQGAGGGGGGAGGGGLFGGGGGGQGDDDDEQQQDEDPIEPILQLIQQTIDPESWREAGGNVGAIQALNQQIIVTQTSTAHQELRDLLRQLRQARALQVAVEARYVTISRNWLEQIGVDLDFILNNGNAGFDRTTILNPATGNPVLVPRQFTRLGFGPGAPGGIGITQPTQPFGNVFGQPGLVPATGDVGPASSTLTPIPIVNNTLDLASPQSTNIPGSLGGLANTSPAFQIFGSFLDNIQVDFLLRATQVDRRSSDLDAPRLTLFNGQRATFESFIEQDYIAALIPIIGDNAGAFLPVVDTALTGRSLDVQATVSADRRYVTMTVRTFTRITGDFRTVFFGGSQTVGSGFIELATQTTQQIRTTVSVPDGGTLLIGGLKLSAERDVDAGVPVLSRVPILKRAFSNTSNVKDDQVLLILIKPTIIIQEEAEADAFPSLSSAAP